MSSSEILEMIKKDMKQRPQSHLSYASKMLKNVSDYNESPGVGNYELHTSAKSVMHTVQPHQFKTKADIHQPISNTPGPGSYYTEARHKKIKTSPVEQINTHKFDPRVNVGPGSYELKSQKDIQKSNKTAQFGKRTEIKTNYQTPGPGHYQTDVPKPNPIQFGFRTDNFCLYPTNNNPGVGKYSLDRSDSKKIPITLKGFNDVQVRSAFVTPGPGYYQEPTKPIKAPKFSGRYNKGDHY